MTASERPIWNGVFISDERIARLSRRVAAYPEGPAYIRLVEQAERAVGREALAPDSWYVAPYYVDAEAHRRAKRTLLQDANDAYSAALVFRLTGSQRYADAAIALINAWVRKVRDFSTEDDSGLVFSYHFPAMIFAADLLRDSGGWATEQQDAFARFLQEKALGMNTMERANNWGNWGTLLTISIAAYARDHALFSQAMDRWKELLDSQIADDGTLPHEITRNQGTGNAGVWYTHFSLQPQTLAAEVALTNGVDVYDYRSPTAMGLQDAFEVAARWAENPSSFPVWQGDVADLVNVRQGHFVVDEVSWSESSVSYFEILVQRWPDSSAEHVLSEDRPVSTFHSAPHLSFTHGASPLIPGI